MLQPSPNRVKCAAGPVSGSLHLIKLGGILGQVDQLINGAQPASTPPGVPPFCILRHGLAQGAA
jgi:hypothetical protein